MATKTNELPIAQSAGLTDHAIVDTAGGTVRLPLQKMPAAGMLTTTTLTNVDFNALELGKVVNISYPTGDGDASKHSPLGELESKTDVTWYVAETFGVSNRVMQIAHAPFRMHRRSFVRYSHDGTWSKWMEFAATEQICNDNLLDNWYFPDPINQRQITSFTNETAVHKYFMDRWTFRGSGGASCLLGSDGLTITRGSSFVMNQPLEYKFNEDTTVTLSILTADGKLGKFTTVIPKSGAFDSWGPVVDGVQCDVYATSTTVRLGYFCFRILSVGEGEPTDTVTIKAIKLELGTRQTLAHENGDKWVLNTLPNKAVELAKCQRYYVKIAPGTIEGASSMPLGIAHIGETEYVNFQVIVPTPMRANPTVKYHNLVLVDMTANTRTNLPDDGIVTITDCSAGNVHVNIRFEGWNLDNTHIYRIFVNAGGFLEFSSDL